jgi:hypothetical protein
MPKVKRKRNRTKSECSLQIEKAHARCRLIDDILTVSIRSKQDIIFNDEKSNVLKVKVPLTKMRTHQNARNVKTHLSAVQTVKVPAQSAKVSFFLPREK